jgi:hypothetical protein
MIRKEILPVAKKLALPLFTVISSIFLVNTYHVKRLVYW